MKFLIVMGFLRREGKAAVVLGPSCLEEGKTDQRSGKWAAVCEEPPNAMTLVYAICSMLSVLSFTNKHLE